MRCILLLCAFVALVQADNVKEHYNLRDAPQIFEKYKRDYNKVYKNPADEAVHYSAFVKSLKIINESNKASTTASFGLNYIADYTPEEVQHLLGIKNSKYWTMYFNVSWVRSWKIWYLLESYKWQGTYY